MMIEATCSSTVATITMNATPNPKYPYRYLYKNAYYAPQGATSWTPITLTGPNLISNTWLPAQGIASITLPAAATPVRVIGYICSWTGFEWKCGCMDRACTTSYWQLQKIQR